MYWFETTFVVLQLCRVIFESYHHCDKSKFIHKRQTRDNCHRTTHNSENYKMHNNITCTYCIAFKFTEKSKQN